MLQTCKSKLTHLSQKEYRDITEMCFLSRNLYNEGLYIVRQYFFKNSKYIGKNKLYHQLKLSENYKLLNSSSGTFILNNIDQNMRSFFALLRKKKLGQYNSKIRLPKYLKKDELKELVVDYQSLAIKNNQINLGFSRHYCQLKKLKNKAQKFLTYKIPLYIQDNNIKLVRIVSKNNYFEINFIYEVEEKEQIPNNGNYLSIDLGLNNLATCYDNNMNTSYIIDGKKIKSVNQWFNKEKARLTSIKDNQKIKTQTKKLIRLSERRFNLINNYFNQSVNYIIKYCLKNDISQIVVGEWNNIKLNSNLGKRNNQHFTSIPHGLLKAKLEGKCKLHGLTYLLQEESYTSKCSIFEKIERKEKYEGVRIHRGLYQIKNKISYNSDVGGAINILRKSKPKVSNDGWSSGIGLTPLRIREPEKACIQLAKAAQSNLLRIKHEFEIALDI